VIHLIKLYAVESEIEDRLYQSTLLFLNSLFPKTETNARCFLWKQNISPPSDLRGRAFLEQLLCRTSYSKDCIQRQKEQDIYKSETWNVNTLNQAGNFENLKKETQRNAVSVLGVSKERLKKKVFCSCYIVYVLGIAFRDSLCETEKCRRPTRAFCFSLRPIEMASYRKCIHSPKIIGPVVKTHSL
jgi:hypothetical protein